MMVDKNISIHYVITLGRYSDYDIDSVWDTEIQAIKRIESKDDWDDIPKIEVWCGAEHIKTLQLQKGGFVEGQLVITWESKELFK